jgi:ribosomal protein L22
MSLQLATRYSVRGKRLLRYVRSSIREKKLIFRQIREERQAEAAVALLAHIIQVLTPLPFFRTSLIGLVKKLISPTEPYSDLVSSSINFSDSSCALL